MTVEAMHGYLAWLVAFRKKEVAYICVRVIDGKTMVFEVNPVTSSSLLNITSVEFSLFKNPLINL